MDNQSDNVTADSSQSTSRQADSILAYLEGLDPSELEVPEDIDVRVISKAGPGRHTVPLTPYTPRGADILDSDLFNHPATTQQNCRDERKREKNSDRVIGLLHSQGYSGVQIAEHLGMAKATVYAVLRLPWVRELVREEIKKYNLDASQQMLQSALMDNIEFLQDVVHDDEVQTRDRITAAKELLDRTLGKSNQVVTHKQDTDLEKLSDEALAEIATRGGGDITIVQRDRSIG